MNFEKLIAYILKHTRWSNIGIFGNSYFGKLVILAPFIAQAVRYSDDFFVNQLGLSNVIFLYWSLIFISIGQILYMWKCPTEIRKYGKDITLYKIESLQSLHEQAFSDIHHEWLKTWFKNANHVKGFESPLNSKFTKLELPKFTSRHAAEDHAKEVIVRTEPRIDKKSLDQMADTYWSFYKNVTDYFCHPKIDWDEVNTMYRNYRVLFDIHHKSSRSQTTVTPILNRIGGSDDTRWKTEALTWYITRLDTSIVNLRVIIAFFYLLGSFYFIWHIPKNIANMAIFSFRYLFYDGF